MLNLISAMNRLSRLRGLRLTCAACSRNYFDLVQAKPRNFVLGNFSGSCDSKAFCHSQRVLVKSLCSGSLDNRIDLLNDAIEKTLRPFMESSEFTPTDVANAVCELERSVYESLRSIPWLQESVRVAYMQMLLSDELNKHMKPLHDHPLFIEFIERIQQTFKAFDTFSLTNTLRALICLGVDSESTLMHNLYYAWRERLPTNDCCTLRISSVVYKNYEFDMSCAGVIVRRVKELLDQVENDCATDGNKLQSDGTRIFYLALCILNVRHLISVDILKRASNTFFNVVRSLPDDDSPESYYTIGTCAQLGRIIQKFDESLAKKLFLHVESTLSRLIAKQTPASTKDLATIGKQVHLDSPCHREISALLMDCVITALDQRGETMSVRELTNCFVAARHQSISFLQRFEPLLLKALQSREIDVITLSDICLCLTNLNGFRGSLVRAVHDLVALKFDLILKTFSILAVVARFLLLYESASLEQRTLLASKLIPLLERPIEMHFTTVALLALYLLQDRVVALPPLFVERLSSLRFYSSLVHLHQLQTYIGIAHSRATGKARTQLGAIQRRIDENLAKRFNNPLSLHDINQYLRRSLASRSQQQQPRVLSDELVGTLVGQYLERIEKASPGDIREVTVALLKSRIYDSRLVEKIVQLLISNGDQQLLLAAFKMCTFLGHQSCHGDALVAALLPLCDTYHEQGQLAPLLLLLDGFCRNQVFTELELSRIFTLDFIEELESYVREKPWYKKVVLEFFMRLNRSVVLECPQLNVPWFHENYCFKNFNSKHSILRASLLNGEVRNTLADIVGGSAYYQTSTYSPYYHHINFLCTLNTKHNRAVKTSQTGNMSGLQQVAILLMDENHYCLNSHALLGLHQQNLRQLEIMNYKVVVVPHFEWYSMALADDSAKRSYLAKKIFA